MEAGRQEESTFHVGSIWATAGLAVKYTFKEGLPTLNPVSGNMSTHQSPIFATVPSDGQINCHTIK